MRVVADMLGAGDEPMLSSFTIKNFKSYRNATLKLAPLTVLIGANASGKSNAIEGLRLLSWIAAGNRLGSFRYVARNRERVIGGSMSELGFRGIDTFTFCCALTEADWNQYAITLNVREDDELHIEDERVTGPGSCVPLFEVVTPSSGTLSDMFVAYNNFARGGIKPQISCSDQLTVLWQLTSPARFFRGHSRAKKTIPETCRKLHQQLSKITFLNPRPSLMRNYSFRSERTLSEGGANLSGVLYNLCRNPNHRDELLDLIHALPEQDIKGIDFIKTPRGEVMITLTETFDGHTSRYDATLLSDGTLRVLAIAAAILSAPSGLVVIEEIDNCVHPNRAVELLSRIARIAKRRNIRVLISSHNPALLDAIPDESVPDVVCCYRDPKDGSSRLIRLNDVPDYPELVAQGTVGHLMTHGIVGRYVKGHPDSEERKARVRAWLKDLRREVM